MTQAPRNMHTLHMSLLTRNPRREGNADRPPFREVPGIQEGPAHQRGNTPAVQADGDTKLNAHRAVPTPVSFALQDQAACGRHPRVSVNVLQG